MNRKLAGPSLSYLQSWKGLAECRPRRALFRGFRHRRERHPGEPVIDELLEPRALGHVMHRAIGEVMVARPCAGQFEAGMAARGPAVGPRVGHTGGGPEAGTTVE